MDAQIALILTQDGLVNGAVYALLALALVLVFAVTRIIFIPQGEFVAYGALTMAAFEATRFPPTIYALLILALAVTVVELIQAHRGQRLHLLGPRIVAVNLLPALLTLAVVVATADQALPQAFRVLLTLAIVVPMGPLVYRLAYEPVAEASVLVLLIISVAVHFVLVGCGLFFFGAEGSRTEPFSESSLALGPLVLSGQTIWVMGLSVLLAVFLWVWFEKTMTGKSLRATAMNRVGARLMGISTVRAGKLSFALAAFIGVLSGVMVAPITTIYYDSGFLIGLKGFVGAIVGGMVSYPLAVAGALMVGLLEAFSSFWASAYKEVIVFTLIIPVLIWRSLASPHHDEEQH